jgi:CheY-like chemotaxis protein
MLVRRLRRRGFEMVEAVDGLSGIEVARAERPELILLDMSLPGLDGWQTVQLLKADEALRGIPVLALTAHAMSGDRERALAVGCDEYDAKPVDLPRLLSKIQKLLDRAS